MPGQPLGNKEKEDEEEKREQEGPMYGAREGEATTVGSTAPAESIRARSLPIEDWICLQPTAEPLQDMIMNGLQLRQGGDDGGGQRHPRPPQNGGQQGHDRFLRLQNAIQHAQEIVDMLDPTLG